ncbi:MAG: hypothetical protein AVDCRST_MAG73-4141 [uncultured Thermomicrobiales bacterium]|uniref:Uncharacterized protein n=1 Tax=uncultured Thermomicrobiales bacterium TaxID=1645740 RepID=A0A6J4V0A6_9BACT|nr:MAG: hypothetical protein AVDCRST_MAG73-4141 [uncultured Thermomicrobiales bacterium]
MATKQSGRTTSAGASANGKTPDAVAGPEIAPVAADPEKLLRRSGKAERRLLDRERRAELTVAEKRDRLSAAESKLAKAQARVMRRRVKLDEAVEILRQRQRSRAEGPSAETADEGASASPETVIGAADGTASGAVEPESDGLAMTTESRPATASASDGAKPPASRRKARTAVA